MRGDKGQGMRFEAVGGENECCKSAGSKLKLFSGGEVRHEECASRDSIHAIHAVQAMVGGREGMCQIGNWSQPSSCGFVEKSSHHVGAFFVQAYFHHF